ncbi:MAG: hypothetical protein R3272_14885, partial [Candidatus Promineifilaceae bacterium]|nr:hypothetical protein [Candidatus Promineifilaceae bacterium]
MLTHKAMLAPALLLTLALALLVAAPVAAHGGGDGEPAAPLIVALIYLQLLLIPGVGMWLGREAVDAWRPRRRGNKRS